MIIFDHLRNCYLLAFLENYYETTWLLPQNAQIGKWSIMNSSPLSLSSSCFLLSNCYFLLIDLCSPLKFITSNRNFYIASRNRTNISFCSSDVVLDEWKVYFDALWNISYYLSRSLRDMSSVVRSLDIYGLLYFMTSRIFVKFQWLTISRLTYCCFYFFAMLKNSLVSFLD